MLKVERIENEPVDSNCFVVFDKAVGDKCIIVDPGSEKSINICPFIDKEGLWPEYIILSHEHFDHCWGVNLLKDRYPGIKLVSSNTCSNAIQNKKTNYSVFYDQPGFNVKAADIIIGKDNWSLDWNQYEIVFYPAGGHSASGLIFKLHNYIFTGDELIKDIKTVTKLKTGSRDKLKESKLLLDSFKNKGLTVCPGHGEMFKLDDYDLNKMLG